MDAQLRSSLSALKAGTEEALQMLFVLQQTINNGGLPEMAQWPEILDKYDVMMRKLSGLQNTLERGFSSPDPTQAGFIRFTSLRNIALVPGAPVEPGPLQDQFNTLSRTLRAPLVLSADTAAVERINARLGLDNLADTVINVRMDKLVDEHDARVSTAAFIIDELASQYNWSRREEDLDEEEEAGNTQPDAPAEGGPGSVGPSISQRIEAAEADSDDDMEMVAGAL